MVARKSRTPAERDVQRPEDLRLRDNPFLGASDIQDLRDAIRALTATLVDERAILRDQLFISRETLRIQQEQLVATKALHAALVAKLGNGHDLEPLSSTT